MQANTKNFLPLAQRLGFSNIARRGLVCYQVVGRFAKNPTAGYKKNVTRRIADAMIALGEEELVQLQQELNDVKTWRAQTWPE